jgi:hypothetical protein
LARDAFLSVFNSFCRLNIPRVPRARPLFPVDR